MSEKTQHNNILLAVLCFTAVVGIVALIGFLTIGNEEEVIQGQVEVTEYRLLTGLQCPLAGVAYSWQMVEAVPTDPWDIRLDLVVTDSDCYSVR